MLVGLGLMVAMLGAPLAEVPRACATASAALPAGEPTALTRRAARTLARASRAAESAGDLPAALDLARESYVLRPSRRALQRVDALTSRLRTGPALVKHP